MPKISMKAARVNANLSRREIADKMEVSERTIQSWENGERYPKLSSLKLFAEICGFETSDIFLPNNLCLKENLN